MLSSSGSLASSIAGLATIFSGAMFCNAVEPCRIEIIDRENGLPVPLVELSTTSQVHLVSDNAGLIAFDLPELMGIETWFTVKGHGYRVAADAFGYQGIQLTPHPGQRLQVIVDRSLPAMRLGRITGSGLFAESQKLGEHLDWKEQKIVGCDSVQNTVFLGRTFWAWGDTAVPNYPLGLFNTIGGTTELMPIKSFEPPIKLRYDYIADANGRARDVADVGGAGPTWLEGCVSLPDAQGIQRLVATYTKIESPLTAVEQGLCVWNDQTQQFKKSLVLWSRDNQQRDSDNLLPNGHAVNWTDEDGLDWILFGDPFPVMRCRATYEAWSDPMQWERLIPQESVPVKHLQDSELAAVKPHRGAIAWNAYRKCWVTIFTQKFGQTSELGELWYAEATRPTGPWRDAVHVVTHDRYTFYNPQLHAEFVDADSPILLFEATYTHTFSKTQTPTPRHDYNQIMYRLDLDRL